MKSDAAAPAHHRPVVRAADAPTFELPGLTVRGLAAPSRGSTETSVWSLVLAPGASGAPHRVTREEVFVAVSGCAVATLGDVRHELGAGDALVVPAGELFALANTSGEPFTAIAALPVGGQALLAGQEPFTPPWAQ